MSPSTKYMSGKVPSEQADERRRDHRSTNRRLCDASLFVSAGLIRRPHFLGGEHCAFELPQTRSTRFDGVSDPFSRSTPHPSPLCYSGFQCVTDDHLPPSACSVPKFPEVPTNGSPIPVVRAWNEWRFHRCMAGSLLTPLCPQYLVRRGSFPLQVSASCHAIGALGIPRGLSSA